MRRAAVVVAEQLPQGVGHGAGVGGVGHHQAGLAVDHRLVGPPAAPGHLGHPGRRRLEEDDAESLLLESEPPVAAGHGEHVGGTVEPGQVVVVHPAEEPHGRPRRPDEPPEPGRVRPSPAMATVRPGNDGSRAAAAAIRTSIPLRGTSRLMLTTRGPPGGSPHEARALARSPSDRGRNRSRSTPGGISTTGVVMAGAARRASAAG